jgi:hypothetical protein
MGYSLDELYLALAEQGILWSRDSNGVEVQWKQYVHQHDTPNEGTKYRLFAVGTQGRIYNKGTVVIAAYNLAQLTNVYHSVEQIKKGDSLQWTSRKLILHNLRENDGMDMEAERYMRNIPEDVYQARHRLQRQDYPSQWSWDDWEDNVDNFNDANTTHSAQPGHEGDTTDTQTIQSAISLQPLIAITSTNPAIGAYSGTRGKTQPKHNTPANPAAQLTTTAAKPTQRPKQRVIPTAGLGIPRVSESMGALQTTQPKKTKKKGKAKPIQPKNVDTATPNTEDTQGEDVWQDIPDDDDDQPEIFGREQEDLYQMMQDVQVQSGIRKEQDALATAYRRATNTRRPSRRAQTMEALRAEVLRPIGQPATHGTALADEFPPRRAEETDEDFRTRHDIFEQMKNARDAYHERREEGTVQY